MYFNPQSYPSSCAVRHLQTLTHVSARAQRCTSTPSLTPLALPSVTSRHTHFDIARKACLRLHVPLSASSSTPVKMPRNKLGPNKRYKPLPRSRALGPTKAKQAPENRTGKLDTTDAGHTSAMRNPLCSMLGCATFLDFVLHP